MMTYSRLRSRPAGSVERAPIPCMVGILRDLCNFAGFSNTYSNIHLIPHVYQAGIIMTYSIRTHDLDGVKSPMTRQVYR
jgi:hypothetical protein